MFSLLLIRLLLNQRVRRGLHQPHLQEIIHHQQNHQLVWELLNAQITCLLYHQVDNHLLTVWMI